MKRKLILISKIFATVAFVALYGVCTAGFRVNGAITRESSLWTSDLGDGRYRNPVIYADYSDPDVVRVGDDFYLVASSFNCMPGLPVLHSRDLVNWTMIGHVFQKYPFDAFNSPQHGNGVWAPSIRYRNGAA
jgi:beta-xylosidase